MVAKLTPGAKRLRLRILAHANVRIAAQLADEIGDLVNQRLNAADIDVATSVLARAAIARGVTEVAGAWLADVTHELPADGPIAVADLREDLPPGLRPVVFLDPKLTGEARH